MLVRDLLCRSSSAQPVFSPSGQALVNFLSRHSRHWPQGPKHDTAACLFACPAAPYPTRQSTDCIHLIGDDLLEFRICLRQCAVSVSLSDMCTLKSQSTWTCFDICLYIFLERLWFTTAYSVAAVSQLASSQQRQEPSFMRHKKGNGQKLSLLMMAHFFLFEEET